nr:methyltransferase domain-containing protein [Oceanicoccus sp. KOV_DT_Chl]
MQTSDHRWFCCNNHSFDIAKQGYCNLLAVQHKKSREPGDSADMVAARHRFLSGGYYQGISQHVNQLVSSVITAEQSPHILDAGCGEGYYTDELRKQLAADGIASDVMGIDIAKPAVLQAAKRNKNIRWFVANSSRMPVADDSAEILLSLFSPIPALEFYRCLKPQGALILATTGDQHLIELRELLYDTVKSDSYTADASLLEHFTLNKKITVTETIQLSSTQSIKDLLAMTPHYWRVSPERKQVLDELSSLQLTIDVQLHLYNPKL